MSENDRRLPPEWGNVREIETAAHEVRRRRGGDAKPGEQPRGGSHTGVEDPPVPGRVVVREDGDTLIVVLRGVWDLEHPPPHFDRAIGDARTGEVARAVGFDATALDAWDSSLLSFLLQGMTHAESHDLEFRDEGLPREIAALLDLAREVPEREQGSRQERLSFAARLGSRGMSGYAGAVASVSFIGEVTQGFARLLTNRARMQWRDFWVVVQSNSSGALPIVTLISFLVGLIIAFLGAVVLRRFGAGYYVSYLVGYGMLREMAALMTGIIIAGRTGAAFAAELGSMKISEEIDAFETLGMSPIDQLVLPRVLGLFVMMPLLTIYSMFVGIAGGLVVAVMLLDLTVTQFIGGLLTPVTLSDGLLGVFKGTVFGSIIDIVGCMRGLQTGSDAGAVGRAATSAVVTGITLLIVANAVIDWVAALLGV
jgi:phospholipid/cholesterol/gamma-HCH transport system permease protein